MKYLIVLAAIFVLLILQAGLYDAFSLVGSFANLLLLFVTVSAFLGKFNESLVWTLVAGGLLDLASPAADGLFTLSLLFTFLALFFLVNFFLPKDINRLIFLAAIISTCLFFVFSLAVNQLFAIWHHNLVFNFSFLLLRKFWLDLLFNLIFIYPVFWYYQWVMAKANLAVGSL